MQRITTNDQLETTTWNKLKSSPLWEDTTSDQQMWDGYLLYQNINSGVEVLFTPLDEIVFRDITIN